MEMSIRSLALLAPLFCVLTEGMVLSEKLNSLDARRGVGDAAGNGEPGYGLILRLLPGPNPQTPGSLPWNADFAAVAACDAAQVHG